MSSEPPLKKRKIASDANDDHSCQTEAKNDDNTDKHQQSEILTLYEGETNDKNEYHGFGKLVTTTDPQHKYIGNFKNGVFDGFGILFLNVDCTSLLIGNWINNELNGLSLMINEFEYILMGTWKHGIKNGTFKEFEFHSFQFDFNQFIYNQIQKKYDTRFITVNNDSNQETVDINIVFKIFQEKYPLRLLFEGVYVNDERNGDGTLHFEDSGMIKGKWMDGVLNDVNAMYIYPGGKCMLKGEWKNGEMFKAKFMETDTNGNNGDSNVEYCYDAATKKSIGKYPLLKEEYETQRVYVNDSTMDNAGNGLFAKIDFMEGDMVCFYNGIHIKHEIIDNRPWDFNSNALTINDEFCVDIPLEICSVDKYCATLGHYANHNWFKQNAQYQPYFSPRFGDIKCLRAIRNIKKDEEIYVNYDYKDEYPLWYKKYASKHRY